MFENITPQKAIRFTKYSVALICCWPLSSSATKLQTRCFVVLKVLNAACAICLILPLLYALYVHFEDPTTFVTAVALVPSCCQVVLQLCVCTAQHDRLQRLIEEMTDYCEKAKSYETIIFQRYANKFSLIHMASTVWFYSCAFAVVLGTLLTSQPFPTVSEYPFRVDYEPVRTTIFLHQAFVGLQCAACVSVNTLAALLLIFAAARFDILMSELRAAVTVAEFTECLKNYHAVKRYARDVVDGVQYVTLTTIIVSSMLLVISGLTIIERRGIVVKLQFMFLAVTALLEVFTCTWPADSLLEASAGAIRSAYEATWYEQDLRVQKTVLRMLVPQKAEFISFKSVVPELSLKYYCSVTPEKAIAFTRFSIALSCAWPLSSDATKAQMLRYRFLRIAAGLSAMGLFLPVSYAMYLNYGDADVFANTASMIIATTHIMLLLLVFSLLQDRFVPLIEDLTTFCGNMRTYEKRVFQRAATTAEALMDCLKKYYVVTRYTWQVVSGVQYVAFATILINSVIIVFCGYNLIGQQMIIVYMQLIFLVGTSLLVVLMWAIPADHLMEMSEKVTRGAYETTWYEQGLGMQKAVLRIMMPQKPVTISLKCFVPTLNLEYFCSFVSCAFSLLTALRAVLVDSDDILPTRANNSTYMLR
ncbi:uncharacterized protein LOC116429551 isoform X2 [Nomia melanderi]|uniref:uncharacterized protein LOC116429551 isoform X2 n=1 Tax=Nomia melanderi TaxID=2448451 RepID=UPI003FCDF78A